MGDLDPKSLLKDGIPGGSVAEILGALTGGESKNPMSGLAGAFNMMKMLSEFSDGGVSVSSGSYNPGVR
jgi:hypothetical protein